MKVKDLKEGNRYDLTFKWGVLDRVYYGDLCEVGGCKCDCCNKILEKAHIFFDTNDNVTYEDCINGRYTSQYFVGTTCIKKLGIEQSTER